MRLAFAFTLLLSIVTHPQGQAPVPTPGEIREEVIVVANRHETRLSDTPASIVTFSQRQLEAVAAPTLDDVLRQSAGFSIFRRSSSRNSNPTTQGVSMRGVGASGASRSTILLDGVPLNDPFGGWVQWNRVPPLSIDRIEILRGGASSLYGSSGLSGAIDIKPREIDKRFTGALDAFAGTQRTAAASAFFGFRTADWTSDITAATFQTQGYRPVDESLRGPVDGFAGARSSNLSFRFGRSLGDGNTIFLRPSHFGEVRTNGTGLQTNRTHITQLVAGGRASLAGVFLEWRLFGGRQVFDQVFTAVAADRTSESLTRVQRVPAQQLGGSVQGRFVVGKQTFLGGLDARNIRGSSDELAFANNSPTARIDAGGRERLIGVYIQDFARIGERLVLAGRLRYDQWQSYAGFASSRPLATNVTTTLSFRNRTEDAVSPQLSVLYNLSNKFSAYATASRSYRSPTLNELYRAFRVGNVVTLANENLEAEHANNFELGVHFSRKRIRFRTNWFWIDIEKPVANVTLTATPNLITRQRRNAGHTRSRGLEVDGEWTVSDSFVVNGSYLYADSHVRDSPSNPQLVGRRIPQVPRHQLTAQARLSWQHWTFAVQGRAAGSQFDDDLNLFQLKRYAQLDLFASRKLRHAWQIYTGIENVFDSRYSVGRTPVRTVSAPLTLRVGLRWR